MGSKNKKADIDTAWNSLHFESTGHGTRYRRTDDPQGRGSVKKKLPI